jgi:imidazolonepropionase-like amidohydrolase
MKYMHVCKLIFVIMVLTSTNLNAQSDSFIIVDVRVFDGDTTIQKTNVLVQNGLIDAIGPTAENDELPHIDGDGYTLIPGLIDAHTHTESVGQLQESLRFGVTTILDMGTFPEHDEMVRAAAASRKDVADFRSSGIFITPTGGHGTEYGIDIATLDDADKAEDFVSERIRLGADYFKIVINGVRHTNNGTPTMSSEVAHAVVEAGHAKDMLILAHVESNDDVRLAAAAGVDGLVHHWRDSGASPELAELLASKSIFVMPHLSATDGILKEGPKQILSDKMLSPYLSDLSRQGLNKKSNAPAGVTLQPTIDGMRSLINANVLLLAGTDAFTGNTRIVHGASMHRLLELFVIAGLSPEETLRTATSNVSDAFKLSNRGRIKPGMRADMVLMRGDPTQDILATRDIAKVWREGVELDR